MTELSFAAVDACFSCVLGLPEAERTGYLDALDRKEPRLAQEVRALLLADARAEGFLERPIEVPAELLEDLPPGTRLGAYEIDGVLNRGGMGTVYRAHREEPYQQRVAVKVGHAGLENGEAAERFRHERQILARLEHPHIARLYDGGVTPDGRPYLVLELVDGAPLDRYCAARQLPVRARLGLVLAVCAAVQEAHRNLLVHRDLKPSNILVTHEGQVKLIDFGIAKPLPSCRLASGQETRLGLRLMTPEYASPEQILGRPLSTASDVYSLGVVLYELLTGRRPHRGDDAPGLELEQAICEQLPARPSTAARREGSAELARTLAGDLDNILLKALAKEPTERYGTAAELAEDLERYLADRPVRARTATVRYRLVKFLRRHLAAVLTAAVALGVVTQAVARVVVERQRSTTERDKARQTLAILVDTFRHADPHGVGGSALSAEELLESAAAQIALEPGLEPDVEAALLEATARSFLGLGNPGRARAQLDRALTLRRGRRAANHPQVLETQLILAEVDQKEGRYPEAERTLRAVLSHLDATDERADQRFRAQLQLASLLGDLGRHAEARASLDTALGAAEAREGLSGLGVARILGQLARIEKDLLELDGARAHLERALTIERDRLGAEHPRVGANEALLALVLLDQTEFASAEALARQALTNLVSRLDPGHPDIMAARTALATALQAQTRYDEAANLYLEALAAYERRFGEEHPLIAECLISLGGLYVQIGRIADASAVLERGLAIARRVWPTAHRVQADALVFQARASFAQGQPGRALALEQAAYEVYRQALGDDHPATAMALADLGQLHSMLLQFAEALPFLEQSEAIRARTLPAHHHDLAWNRALLGTCLYRLGRFEEGEAQLLRAHEALHGRLAEDSLWVVKIRRRLAQLYEAWGKPELAARYAVAPSDPASPRP